MGAAGDTGSWPGAGLSLLRATRPLKPAPLGGSRVGWTSQPFVTHSLTVAARADSGRCAEEGASLTGRVGIGILVSHAEALSLNDDRLPVMHQPVDQGRGQ